ncbi:MAG: hypothetical protein DRH34_07220 [Deltaproteobacteria bacterium]|nr:MAG: hypothetical protein DRH34_07220 [Deltaproteobacteria bacterium]
MSEHIDETIFADLKACDPEDVILRTGSEFDKTCDQYFVNVWGHRYCVDLKNNEVRPELEGSGLKTYHGFLYLFILYYLMKSKNIPPSGEWVSQKDIPGGAGFFRGPHTIPVELITGRFKDELGLFKKECKKAGGVSIEMADAAYTFEITPTLPVAVLYWQGDEDFPSEAKLLFDRTIEQQLPLDILYALAVEICHTLGK